MSSSPLAVELVAIGTEVVYGLTQDTNTHWMAQQIVRLGGDVQRVTKIKDDLDVIVSTFRESIARGADVTISTGGLGPTADDLTASALGVLTNSRLALHEGVIHDYVTRRGISAREKMTPNLIRMATVPENADVLLNTAGWAPALRATIGGTTFFALAGPPREMQSLFVQYVVPYLMARSTRKTAEARVLVSVARESEIAPYIDRLMADFPGSYLKARLGSTPQEGWLPIDVLAVGTDEENARKALDAILAAFRTQLEADGRTISPYPPNSD